MKVPYTKEELRAMTCKEIMALPKKCPRLHPYCLIGQHIDDVRKRMDEWSKNIGCNFEILTPKQCCSLNASISYYWCDLDENNIMIDVYKPN